MSILMRGVDMPKNCEECNFKGECRQYWEKIREAYTRPSWCPLVEVFDKDINVRSKTMLDCYKCRRYADPTEPCVECRYEPKDEPQTDLLVTEYPQDGEVNLIGKDKTKAVVMAYDVYKELTEPQTERSE